MEIIMWLILYDAHKFFRPKMTNKRHSEKKIGKADTVLVVL